MSPHDPSVLWLGGQYVFRLYERGDRWERVSPDLTTADPRKMATGGSGAEQHCTIVTLSESPAKAGVLWAGTDDGNLQVTIDGGKTWTNVAANYTAAGIPRQTWVSSIEPSRFDKNLVYATFDNHMYGDHKTYAAKSSDLGKTWTMMKGGEELTGFAHRIKEDIVNKDLLFLGTEMGFFASVDGGKEWFRMKNNIPWYALVRDITIHPTSHDLVLATHGRGIIVVDNISPIRNMTGEVINKDVVLFENAPMLLRDGEYGGGSFPATGGWNGGNPPNYQPVQYYLKDRVMSGDVRVEILDKDGKLVQSVPGSKRKGINSVTWNLRMTPPKTIDGAKPGTMESRQANFVAPMVMPGDYTVKLVVGNQSYTQPLKLLHDAKGDMTEADRKAQYDAAMKLYNMQNELAVLVDSLNKEIKLAGDNKEQLKDKKARKLADDYQLKLERLRDTLIVTRTKSMFADEVKLREEIAGIYIAVAGNEAAPSNSQQQRISELGGTLKKHEETAKQLRDTYHAPLLKAYEKENIYIGPKRPGGNTGTGG
jgi:hypothetical protein